MVAILGPFSAHFRTHSNKMALKMEWKNDVKNSYHETLRKGNLEKWSKNAFFSLGTLPKSWKMIIFRVHFCKSEVRVPFFIHSSFNFEKNGNKMKWKNDVKMSEKWTKNANCELPYSFWQMFAWQATNNSVKSSCMFLILLCPSYCFVVMKHTFSLLNLSSCGI